MANKIEYYFDILKNTEKLEKLYDENDISENVRQLKRIKENAMAMLIANGVPVKVEADNYVMRINNEERSISINAAKTIFGKYTPNIIESDDSNADYSVKTVKTNQIIFNPFYDKDAGKLVDDSDKEKYESLDNDIKARKSEIKEIDEKITASEKKIKDLGVSSPETKKETPRKEEVKEKKEERKPEQKPQNKVPEKKPERKPEKPVKKSPDRSSLPDVNDMPSFDDYAAFAAANDVSTKNEKSIKTGEDKFKSDANRLMRDIERNGVRAPRREPEEERISVFGAKNPEITELLAEDLRSNVVLYKYDGKTISFLVAPLVLPNVTGNVPIIVTAISDIERVVVASDDEIKPSVVVNISEKAFTFRGFWNYDKKEFKVLFYPPNGVFGDQSERVQVPKNGEIGHFIFMDNGAEFHIIPTITRNVENGYTQFIFDKRIPGASKNINTPMLNITGEPLKIDGKKITAKWENGSLNVFVE